MGINLYLSSPLYELVVIT